MSTSLTVKNRATKTLVTTGLSAPMGIDTHRLLPWVTICEEHNEFVSSATRRQALAARTPTFCDECRQAFPHLAG